MFSSDLSEDQLKMRLGHMSNTHCQVTIYLFNVTFYSLFLTSFWADFEN